MYQVHLIGNAHLDPVWLWQWQEGFAEIKATFLSALDRMDEFPDFIFTSACAAYYAWIEENAPELFERIKVRVREGRIALAGGFWIQPDCNIPSGESFCRHALYSQRYFLQAFGKTAKIGYNVDSFGHNGMLPQIYIKSGMYAYVYQRPALHEKDLQENLFRWFSPDGSEVLAFRIPMSYEDTPHGVDTSAFEGVHPTVIKIYETLRISDQQDVPLMCFYGVGNHGGGPTIKSLRAIEKFMANNRGKAIYSSPEAYFHDAQMQHHKLTSLHDDLQHHASGCYAACAEIKMLNRKAENRLLTAEKLMSLAAAWVNHPYDNALLQRAWRKLLFNQFHDILAGCCIQSAYTDAIAQFCEAISIADELGNAAFQRISWNIDTSGGQTPIRSKEKDWMLWEYEDRGVPVIVFNPHSFPVEAGIKINREVAGVTDLDGNPLPKQRVRGEQTNGKDLFNTLFLAKLPPLGYTTAWIFKDKETVSPNCGVSASGSSIENQYIRLEIFSKTGEITSIYDKQRAVELLQAPAGAVVIDETHCDTWAHGVFQFDKEIGRFGSPQIVLTETGPLRAAICVRQRYEDTLLCQTYSLLAGSRQIDVDVKMSVRMSHQQVKLCFPLSLRGSAPIYSMPYGFIPKTPNGLEEPAQMWVASTGDLPAGERGMFALINNGKYSFSQHDNCLCMMAVRTPGFADHYGERDAQMEFTDQGSMAFQYAILPCEAHEDFASVVRASRLLNQPPVHIVETYHTGSLPLSRSEITISNPSIVAEVVKRSEADDGYILRLFEASGKQQGHVDIRHMDRSIACAFAPQEIKTLFFPDDPAAPVHDTMITELDHVTF